MVHKHSVKGIKYLKLSEGKTDSEANFLPFLINTQAPQLNMLILINSDIFYMLCTLTYMCNLFEQPFQGMGRAFLVSQSISKV